jgi:thiol-disulfide isomerase/thioredoxin
MDLGFGKENQVVGEAVNRVLSQQTKAQEAAIDEELNRYDSLLEDETALEQLRKRRLEQLKKQQKQRQEWKNNGHGEYRDLVDSKNVDVAKAFFETTKQSERVVVHFYRPTTSTCDIFHKHLQHLAAQHLETKFVKINVEGCEQGSNGASFLVEKLGIVILPTLVLIKNRKVIHHLHGFDELGGSEEFDTKTLAYVLGTHGVLNARDDEVPPTKTWTRLVVSMPFELKREAMEVTFEKECMEMNMKKRNKRMDT